PAWSSSRSGAAPPGRIDRAMRDDLLFASLPYVAAALLVVVPLLRGMRGFDRAAMAASAGTPPPTSAFHGGRAWRYGITVVLVGHVAALVVPDRMIFLTRLPIRLLLLEGTGLLFSLCALWGLWQLVRARLRSATMEAAEPGRARAALPRIADSLFLTLVGLTIVTGLVNALLYRWGVSWYSVTLVPYLHSLGRLEPEVRWMAAMPPLVRLHVLGGIAATAVAPFTALGDVLVRPAAALHSLVTLPARRRAAMRREVTLP
nr:respiratory nitrate reductase subunit gamma [Acidobacteriota bacterium]